MRSENVSHDQKAAFAVSAWIESTAIEEALDAHTCGCDQAFLFQGKEYLFMHVVFLSDWSQFLHFLQNQDVYIK